MQRSQTAISPGPSLGRRRTAETHHRHEVLSKAVESEIVPRLVLARRTAVRQRRPVLGSYHPSQNDIAELAHLVIHRETEAAAFIEALHDRGASMESLYIELLGGCARALGAMWEEDDVTFSHVTTGVWRLQQMMHVFRPAFQAESPSRQTGRRILLTPCLGEQHSFGLSMLAEFFRRDGWSVRSTIIASNADLIDIVRGEWFDLVGFSVGDGTRIDDLRTSIKTSRRASRNLQIGVMVGGPVFIQNPGLVSQVGADVTASDARVAVRQAEQAVTLLARTG